LAEAGPAFVRLDFVIFRLAALFRSTPSLRDAASFARPLAVPVFEARTALRAAARSGEARFEARAAAPRALPRPAKETLAFVFTVRLGLAAVCFFAAAPRAAAARFTFTPAGCLDVFALDVPEFACLVFGGFGVFLTEAITTGSFFLPRFGDGAAHDGGKTSAIR
jgi:hypothetical protein